MSTTHNLKFPLFKNLTDFILTPPINRNELPRRNDQKTIVSFYFGYSNEKIDLPKNFFRFAENTMRYISLPGNHVGSIENSTFSSLKQLKVLDFSQRGVLIPGTQAGKFSANLFSNLSGIQAEKYHFGQHPNSRGFVSKNFSSPKPKKFKLKWQQHHQILETKIFRGFTMIWNISVDLSRSRASQELYTVLTL